MNKKRHSFIPVLRFHFELNEEKEGKEQKRKSSPITNKTMIDSEESEDETFGDNNVVLEEIQSILNNSECSSIVTLNSNNSIISEEELNKDNSSSIIRKEYLNSFSIYSKKPPLSINSSTTKSLNQSL